MGGRAVSEPYYSQSQRARSVSHDDGCQSNKLNSNAKRHCVSYNYYHQISSNALLARTAADEDDADECKHDVTLSKRTTSVDSKAAFKPEKALSTPITPDAGSTVIDLRGSKSGSRKLFPEILKIAKYVPFGDLCSPSTPLVLQSFNTEVTHDSGVGSNLQVGGTMPAQSAGRNFFDVFPHFSLVPPT